MKCFIPIDWTGVTSSNYGNTHMYCKLGFVMFLMHTFKSFKNIIASGFAKRQFEKATDIFGFT